VLAAPAEPRITLENLFQHNKDPHMRARIDFIRGKGHWWENLPPIEMNMRVFQAAKECGFSRMVLTRAPENYDYAWTEKWRWCRKYFGTEVPVKVTSGEKGHVHGDVLFDDYPGFCEDWLAANPNGLVIVPFTVHNQDWLPDRDLNILRYDGQNFDEVIAALKIRVLLFDLGQPAFDRLPYDVQNLDAIVAGLKAQVMLFNLGQPPPGRSFQAQYDLLRQPDSMKALEELRIRLVGADRQAEFVPGKLSDSELRFVNNFPRIRELFARAYQETGVPLLGAD
jgi:hypothetical protein